MMLECLDIFQGHRSDRIPNFKGNIFGVSCPEIMGTHGTNFLYHHGIGLLKGCADWSNGFVFQVDKKII